MSVYNSYLTGSLVRVATYSLPTPSSPLTLAVGGFRDINGNLADPTTVTLKYNLGSTGVTTTVVYPAVLIVKDSVGLYHADLDTTGQTQPVVTWTYEWIGTGAIQAPALNFFQVTLGL